MVYGLVAITLLMSLVCLYSLWRNASQGLVRVWFTLSFAVLVYLYGCWVFLSVYCKYVFALAALAAFIAGLFGHKRSRAPKKPVVHAIFALFFTILNILYFTGSTGVPETVNLTLPFKQGSYLVFQGGKALPTNLFHYGYRGAIYAMDLIKLDDKGRRANSIFSKNLSDYYTFGDTIYSPCNGRIAHMQAENMDNIPPSRKRGPTNTNHVLIDGGSYYVFMGHMKQYSLLVHEGDSVATGQQLGQAGNSGFSLEPHLHIQVHAKEDGKPWYKGRPLYIQFSGRSYLLFQQINTKDIVK